MFRVVLYEPEIPPNTGNIIRLCANTGCELHLIGPLGFSMDDKKLRRAGLDYREWQNVRVHDSWQEYQIYIGTNPNPAAIYGLSTKGQRRYDQVNFQPGDTLLFGPETRGLPKAVMEGLGEPSTLRVPMRPDNRSMNLSNAVSVVVYEAWRQHNFEHGR